MLDEVASYASEYQSLVKLSELMPTFKFCPEGFIPLPCSKSGRVFSRLSEEYEVGNYVYEFFWEFNVVSPCLNLRSIL